MATYNEEKYLGGQIDSLLAQTKDANQARDDSVYDNLFLLMHNILHFTVFYINVICVYISLKLVSIIYPVRTLFCDRQPAVGNKCLSNYT